MSAFPNDLRGQVTWLVAQIGDMKRRDRNRKRTGIVSEVDTAKGLARVRFEIRDGKDYVGPWMPWGEIAAGDIKTHIPPSVGQQVTVVSESGDLADGVIDMSIPSNANPRPHDGAEAVITKGDTRIEIAGQKVTVNTVSALVNAQRVELGGTGGRKVARVGDMVNVGSGSSAGMWPIVEGSNVVTAI